MKFDTSYNENSKSSDNPKIALTYGDKISETSAHVIGITYSSKQIVSYNNETGYGWETNSAGLKEMNDDWEMRYYDLTEKDMVLPMILIFLLVMKLPCTLKHFGMSMLMMSYVGKMSTEKLLKLVQLQTRS